MDNKMEQIENVDVTEDMDVKCNEPLDCMGCGLCTKEESNNEN